MTTTASRAYTVAEVPPTGDDRSRYALASSPGGHGIEPAENVGICANVLAETRIREAKTPSNELKTVSLFRVAQPDGEYVLLPTKTITGEAKYEPVRPGRFVKMDLEGGALLDSFLLGELAFVQAPDAKVWEALRVTCQQIEASGEALRRLNVEVGRLIQLRAGIDPRA